MYRIRRKHHIFNIFKWILIIIGLFLMFDICKVLIEYPHAIYKPAFENVKLPTNQNVSPNITPSTESRVNYIATHYSASQVQKWLSKPSNNQWLNNAKNDAKSNPNMKAGVYDVTHGRVNMKLYNSKDYRTGFIIRPLGDLQDIRLKDLDAQYRLKDLRKHNTFIDKIFVVFFYHKIMKLSQGLESSRAHQIYNIWVVPEQRAYQNAKRNPRIIKNTTKGRTIHIVR